MSASQTTWPSPELGDPSRRRAAGQKGDVSPTAPAAPRGGGRSRPRIPTARSTAYATALALVLALAVGSEAAAQTSVKPYVHVIVDTSYSMTYDASDTGNARMAEAKAALSDVFAGVGEVTFSLHSLSSCSSTCSCTIPSSCGAGDVHVDPSENNRSELNQWVDGTCSSPNNPELEAIDASNATRGTPLASNVDHARQYLQNQVIPDDGKSACRPYVVVVLTDGEQNCPFEFDGSSPCGPAETAVDNLCDADSNGECQLAETYVIGFDTDNQCIDNMAAEGGTGRSTAISASNRTELALAFQRIIADSVLVETCDNKDNDCDGKVDEGFTKYCDLPNGVTDTTLCTEPEDPCDGEDSDCDGTVDEGTRNACGNCGTPPTEVCDAIDNDCDGFVDEGGVCDGCTPAPEICDGMDNDCDDAVDENLTRSCSTSVGACTVGEQVCTDGEWGECDGTTPTEETCNGEDDNCDGVVDQFSETCDGDGNPDDDLEYDNTGACKLGVRTCTSGSWGDCENFVGPTDEVCDAIDNDCDGQVDEDVPTVGDACGTDVGACQPGTIGCEQGQLVCMGGTGPQEEICNNEDDDCDGQVDDGLALGSACGSSMGVCVPGQRTCEDGEIVCRGGVDSSDEICDGADNDCDGSIDEGIPLGDSCGTGEGVCEPGTLQCVDGNEVCVGTVPEEPESCDCNDNDCDGSIDEQPQSGTLCPEGSTCHECQCVVPCRDTVEFGQCPGNRIPKQIDGECFCVSDPCDPDECADQTVERDGETRCAPDDPSLPSCVCKSGECTFPCDGASCTSGTACKPDTGECVVDDCRGLGCPEGQVCNVDELTCVDDACATADCEQACRLVDGEARCEESCAGRDCGSGRSCRRGECVEDPCADLSCGQGEVCDPEAGECVEAQCVATRCPEAMVCDPATGDCVPDPCWPLDCPQGEVCRDGECALPGDMTDAGPGGNHPDAGPRMSDAGQDLIVATGGGGCACRVPGEPRSGHDAPWLYGLALLAGACAWRRRQR